MNDLKFKGEPINFHPLKEEKPRVDKTTESIYKQCKQLLSMIGDRLNDLPRAQKKHFTDYKLFVEGYEAGAILDWMRFFKTPDEMVKAYRSRS